MVVSSRFLACWEWRCCIFNDFPHYPFYEQVMRVVQKRESLKRISFLAHSLGGLFARYAISVLYSEIAVNTGQSIDVAADTSLPNSNTTCSSRRGMIAGLEPINFITLATPHLGVRGRKQVCSGHWFLICSSVVVVPCSDHAILTNLGSIASPITLSSFFFFQVILHYPMNNLLININLNVLFWLFATLWFGCLLVVCISVSHLQYSLGLKTMQRKLNLNNFLYCQ